MRKYDLTCITFFIAGILFSCSGDKSFYDLCQIQAERTTSRQRAVFKADLIENRIENVLKNEPALTNEKEWISAFWAMGLARYRSAVTDQAIHRVVGQIDHFSEEFQRALLEVIITLYQTDFTSDIEAYLEKTVKPKLFAMSAFYLSRQDSAIRDQLNIQMKAKYPDDSEQPILTMLEHYLKSEVTNSTPDIRDLFRTSIMHQPVVFSLQREDRRHPGIAIIRDKNGNFLRDHTDQIFHIRQLTLSSSNMPGFLTNGNSPQGIYSIQGIDHSENVFIGPSPTLQLVLPFEVEADSFFHAEQAKLLNWNINQYQQLLPESWQNYLPIYEAYFAGQAGRTEIIAHGSTIDPKFYQSEPFYPLTPSLGCLTALEIWDTTSGHCLKSDQIRLVNALTGLCALKGFLIVVELDDQARPVELNNVEHLIWQAENMNQKSS